MMHGLRFQLGSANKESQQKARGQERGEEGSALPILPGSNRDKSHQCDFEMQLKHVIFSHKLETTSVQISMSNCIRERGIMRTLNFLLNGSENLNHL